MKKSTKRSLAKIKPAEYKESVIKALECRLVEEGDRYKKLQENLNHSRAIVIALTHRIGDFEKNIYNQQRIINEQSFVKTKRGWFSTWIK